jgi:monoterpene epsilon-lactone hydrolase
MRRGYAAPAKVHVINQVGRRDLLAKFPPTLLQTSSIGALVSDAKKLAVRFEDAGVRTVSSIWPDLPHVWHVFVGLFPEATEALQEIADFVVR